MMEVLTKVILVTGCDMALGYGKIINNAIKDFIKWIKNKDGEYIYGKIRIFTKENLNKIIDKDMVNYTGYKNLKTKVNMNKSSFIKVDGKNHNKINKWKLIVGIYNNFMVFWTYHKIKFNKRSQDVDIRIVFLLIQNQIQLKVKLKETDQNEWI